MATQEVQTKTCSKCGVTKPITEFHKQPDGKYGVAGQCAECKNDNRRTLRSLNSPKTKLTTLIIDGISVEAKQCKECGEVKPLTDFRSCETGIGGVSSRCRLCMSTKEREKRAARGWKKIPRQVIENNGEVVAVECLSCRQLLPPDEFRKNKNRRGGVESKCRKCMGIKRLEKSEIVTIKIDDKPVLAKECKECREVKPLTEYPKGKSYVGGVRPVCKVCSSKTGMTREEFMRSVKSEAKRRRAISKLNKAMEGIKIQTRPIVVSPDGIASIGKRCSKCAVIKPLSDYWGKDKGEKIMTACRECAYAIKKEYAKNNRHIIRRYERAKELKRRAFEKHLRADFKLDDLSKVGVLCELTGSEDVHYDHFIPLATGHGGTYMGNIVPLSAELNSSKKDLNPFEWIKTRDDIPREKWDAMIEKLASLNSLTVDEFRDFVYWCFENKRTIHDIIRDNKANKGDSLTIWRSER